MRKTSRPVRHEAPGRAPAEKRTSEDEARRPARARGGARAPGRNGAPAAGVREGNRSRADAAPNDVAPPGDRETLRLWLRAHLGIEVPERGLVAGAATPLDYLEWAFFEESHPATRRAAGGNETDCIVWACRGGGKTFYAAVATLLDLIYKPGIRVTIMGGSLLQSARMHEHLRGFFEHEAFAPFVAGRITDKRVRLVNGSVAELVAPTHTSVRGSRPQKLRCDEVELIEPGVWRAAQLVTRSAECGGVIVRGGVEAFSTWHRRGGLMTELVGRRLRSGLTHTVPPRRLFRWGVLDVLGACPESRPCEPCALLPECERRAKRPHGGHIPVDDAVTLKTRSDADSWESEMLCRRPSAADAVFRQFSRETHVVEFEVACEGEASCGTARGGAPADMPPAARRLAPGGRWLCGMDFGFAAPTVILWAYLDPGGVLWVADERIASGVVLADHAEAMVRSRPTAGGVPPEWVGIDPAGRQRHGQTGISDARVLQRAGLAVKSRRLPLEDGLRAVRARLAPALGPPRLFIHPRCDGLIHALERYRYPARRATGAPPGSADAEHADAPKKDGADHAADALRYLVINVDAPAGGGLRCRGY